MQVLLFLGCMFVIAPATKIVPFFTFLFTNFLDGFNYKEFMLSRFERNFVPHEESLNDSLSLTTTGRGFLISTSTGNTIWESPWAVLGVQVACTWLAYIFAKFACKWGQLSVNLCFNCKLSGATFRKFASPSRSPWQPRSVSQS